MIEYSPDIPLKRCSTCKSEFPSTSEYFTPNKKVSSGLRPRCKKCTNLVQAERRVKLKEKLRELPPGTYKICPRCEKELPATNEYFYVQMGGKYGFKAQCKECSSTYTSSTPERREKWRKWKAARRRSDPQFRTYENAMHALYRAQYRNRDIEGYLARQRGYWKNRREVANKRNRERYASSSAMRLRQLAISQSPEGKAYRRHYQRTHPEQMRKNHQQRRAFLKQAQGTLTAQDIQQQKARQKDKCYYCKKKLPSNYHVDHIVPLSRHGTNDPSNIVIACPHCNTSKHNSLLHEWSKGGRLL